MKIIYKKYHTCCKSLKMAFFLASLLFITSCDSILEVDLPKSQLTKTTVFQDYATANAAMIDIYSKIRDKGLLTGTQFGISNYLGNYADELAFYGAANNATIDFYNNTVVPSNTTVLLFWNNTYNQIYAANAVLEGIKESKFTAQQKAQLEGEVLFVRALLHFYLQQLFGDVPYIKTTDYRVNSIVTRTPSDQIYSSIIADLNTSINSLLPAYSSTDRVRPNAFTAKALLSRVHLYKSGWEEAKKAATDVIDYNSLYVFENTLSKVFLNNSSETIWQFIPSIVGKNTDEGATFIFTSGPPPNMALTESLMNSFATNDLRKTQWTAAVSNAAGTWYYPFKYKEARVSTTSKEYSIVFRLTEQYLIRSEARAQLGDLIGAKEDLNKIRRRAGLSDITTSFKEEVLDAILQERRKELFTEYGHRFFDLKRMDKLNITLANKPGWNSNDSLLPIPESEMNVNPNLRPQNPSY